VIIWRAKSASSGGVIMWTSAKYTGLIGRKPVRQNLKEEWGSKI
jgi:hypothetical protein